MSLVETAIGAASGLLGGGSGSTARPKHSKAHIKHSRPIIQMAHDLYQNPGNYPQYPTSTPFGPMNPWEMAMISGYGDLAGMAGDLSGQFSDNLFGMLGGGTASNPYAAGLAGIPGMLAGSLAGGAPQVAAGQVGGIAQPHLNANQGMYGSTAGINADPNAALNSILSGSTAGFDDALNAAFGQSTRNFTERLLPQLNVLDDQFTGGQGGSGALKVGQRALEDLTQQQNELAAQYGYQAHTDAQNRQLQGAGLATDAALSQSAQNLQGAGLGQQFGLNQANLGLNTAQLNLGAAEGNRNAALQAALSNQGAFFDQLGAMNQAAGVGSAAAGRADQTNLNLLSQIPNVYNLALGGPEAFAAAGGGFRSITDPFYQNEYQREQYNANLPFQMLNQYAQLEGGLFGGSAVGPQVQSDNMWANVIGGGLLGYLNAAPRQRTTSAPTPYGQAPAGGQYYGATAQLLGG